MAANKFATMLHGKTNRITFVLVYAFLEWFLIVFLLLNSLFSHLIIKFSEFFGLNPPCLWCAKGFHMNICNDLMCAVHAKEVSKFSYCSYHHKLVESKDMCNECFCSSRVSSENCLLKCAKESGTVHNSEKLSLNCSCCGLLLSDNMHSAYLLLKASSLDVFKDLIIKVGDYDDDGSEKEYGFDYFIRHPVELYKDGNVLGNKIQNHVLAEMDETCLASSESERKENGSCVSVREKNELDAGEMDLVLEIEEKKDESLVHDLEFFLDYSGHRLVPFELIDSITEEHERKDNVEIKIEDKLRDREVSLHPVASVGEKGALVVELDDLINIKQETELLDSHLGVDDFVKSVHSNIGNEDQELTGAAMENHLDVHTASVDVANNADVSVGTEISDVEQLDGQQNQEFVHLYDDCWTSSHVHETGHNEIGEDNFPDTPTSIDSLHQRFILLGRTESVTVELESGDGVVSIDRLKSALKSERKALKVMYAELEEERSASAVATSQTMAMINRLQEEKAAMQMEALQYQRMMEEQSEYDQDALQLLNEHMANREREKQELERELKLCRKKLLEYETSDKMREILTRNEDGSAFSSPSESDGLSIDLNPEAKEIEEGFYSHQECRTVNAIFKLEEFFSDFESERLSILEHLKVIEEKFVRSQHGSTIEDFRGENENYVDENIHYTNGHVGGFSETIGGQKGKSLLPLFDAVSDENGDTMLNGTEVDSPYESLFEKKKKKIAVEEIDYIYEKLQALEVDREFFKQCINCFKKGDKGIDLLQGILQHLYDLRNVELHVTM